MEDRNRCKVAEARECDALQGQDQLNHVVCFYFNFSVPFIFFFFEQCIRGNDDDDETEASHNHNSSMVPMATEWSIGNTQLKTS